MKISEVESLKTETMVKCVNWESSEILGILIDSETLRANVIMWLFAAFSGLTLISSTFQMSHGRIVFS
jgi:hypothetical protein